MEADSTFNYIDERFADIQMLRYRLKGFDNLSTQQKIYIYYLAKATLAGRDIVTKQQCQHNIRIRKTLEAIYKCYQGSREDKEFLLMETYLKKVWFANGIHHHYSCEKFIPDFSVDFFKRAINEVPIENLPLTKDETLEDFFTEICKIIFNRDILFRRVNLEAGADLVATSACNYYDGVKQSEVEQFYNEMKNGSDETPPSYGLNSKLRKVEGRLVEETWTTSCHEYGKALQHVVEYLRKATEYAENNKQKELIEILIRYYQTGDLRLFDEYSIKWIGEQNGCVDFINGFIEVYGDPLGIKASWEGLVEYKDVEATQKTRLISDNALWFEDNSPVSPQFKKEKVRGVTANVICAAMLGGDEYPASAIGINLPNADWIRTTYGSKSVTIGNLTEAYNHAAKGNGFYEEFICDENVLDMVRNYADLCDNLHTDLHECLGHGSGKLLPGVAADALKSYGSTIEEARADLFGLYYIADKKLVELGLLPNHNAYKAHYYTYILNGLMTQLARIKPGGKIEESHMRNRALISRWVYEKGNGVISLKKIGKKTYLEIKDHEALRRLFAELLAEIQRIKSEGDLQSAQHLVETYAISVEQGLHSEVIERYTALGIAPYKGFINPRMELVTDEKGSPVDVKIDYTETYTEQMLRYGREYGYL